MLKVLFFISILSLGSVSYAMAESNFGDSQENVLTGGASFDADFQDQTKTSCAICAKADVPLTANTAAKKETTPAAQESSKKPINR
ncbi:MAG: hypothetical protein AB7F59_14460 [Bdellovibrionales bacterium]